MVGCSGHWLHSPKLVLWMLCLDIIVVSLGQCFLMLCEATGAKGSQQQCRATAGVFRCAAKQQCAASVFLFDHYI